MPTPSVQLGDLAQDFADVIPDVDATAEHERWDPGLGPFEEERQLEMILTALSPDGATPTNIKREVSYPDSGRRCDLVIDTGNRTLPVEAKLLRFRLDNGNIDPNMYKSIFSPFPERSSSSLLTDAQKLTQSAFDSPCGLLGIYYEKEGEEYDQLRAERIAEKFEHDIEYWYDIDIETVAIAKFDGLQHPHHQKGAVIGWVVE
ncbi:transcriptional regulator [Halorubrum sp. CBA1229]|uniref:transcriptional regulator n=1 Tax=Halorubrum sp. CBA1229 TaxID=1853699 RepID=UPI000F3CE57B|nr:transcriptional regulator [Halorubrum sp. CBA1229]QKY18293.1 transcriptional regulator [Halorubrum sp. CBA1229]